MDIYYYVDHRKTLLELEFENRIVQFFSTDDLNSAKLRGRQNTFFYLNEANTIPFEAYIIVAALSALIIAAILTLTDLEKN